MNIILIGMRGSGKSTIAKLLSAKKPMKYISTDEMIIKNEGKSINEIVAKKGWVYFRECEAKVIAQLTGIDYAIVDTGGGIILKPINIALLKSLGKVIWLKAPISVLYKRIASDTSRPPLTDKSGPSEMRIIYDQRKNLYKNAADLSIVTSGKSFSNIIKEILLCMTP